MQNLGKQKNKKNGGITLIALVITIIVLLILAGITIGALSGDNSVVEEARNAKRKTEISQWEEKIDIAILQAENNHLNPDIDDVIAELIDADIIEDASKVDKSTGVITTKDPSYEVSDKLGDYLEKPLGPGEIVTGGNKDYENNGTAKIPVGFMVVPGADDVSKGLVISDNPADTEVDSNNIVAEGNQFVWVPVNKDNLCVDGIEGKEVAEIASGTDYRGVLYNFSGTTSSKTIYSPTKTREPDVVTGSFGSDYDNDTEYLGIMNNILKKVDDNFTEFINAEDFKNYMQIEYNNIINSIKTNGGFYIGRYESSLSSSNATTDGATGTIQSKRNVLPAGANNTETAYRWYGLYAKQKEFASTLEGSTVKSTMIYGSMYDAVMNWALSDENEKDKVTESSTKRGSKQPTGTEIEIGQYDIIKNIYDLGNNISEWTAEANGDDYRVVRGGNYNNTESPEYRRYVINPYATFNNYGSRLLLYL